MRGKGFKALFLLAMLTIPLVALWPKAHTGQPGTVVPTNPQSMYDNTLPVNLESYTAKNFPLAERWRQFRLDIKMLGGQKEHNGIYLSSLGLVKKTDPPVQAALAANLRAVSDFAAYCQELDRPVYLALLPSAEGIQPQKLPSFSSPVNQIQIIEDIYSEMLGQVTLVGVHNVLEEHRSQYIYYRTEDMLTAYGGFLVYQEMLGRLLGQESGSLSQYNVTYQPHRYYGSLYQAAPYRDVAPDILATYQYTAYKREYLVSHTQTSGRRVYHTLYPAQALELGSPMDLYLGGQSAVTDIRTTAPNNRKLLVFGDRTALSYLPFLVNHYRQVTLVDLFHNEGLYASIRPEDYSQVLLAYGFDSFTSTANPSRLRTLMR